MLRVNNKLYISLAQIEEMVDGINRSYEDKIKTKYSKFKNTGIGTWNSTLFRRRWINMYTDEEMIKEYFIKNIVANFNNKKELTIIDYGGGDGTLISIVKKHLEKESYKIKAINLDLNSDSLRICRSENEEIEVIEQNLLEPFNKYSADIVLCRFVVQYQSKEEQVKLIENIYNSLNKDGLLLLFWPGHPNQEYLNSLESEIVHIITGKDKEIAKNSRHFPTKEEMEKLILNNEFNIIFENGKGLEHFYTAEGWNERFNLTKEQFLKLKDLFKNFSKKYSELFKEIDGFQTHQGFNYFIAAKKT